MDNFLRRPVSFFMIRHVRVCCRVTPDQSVPRYRCPRRFQYAFAVPCILAHGRKYAGPLTPGFRGETMLRIVTARETFQTGAGVTVT